MPATRLDSLYAQVARKVLTESLGVKKGQSVTVEAWNNGLPFARQVVLEARRVGAIPLVVFEDEDAYVEGAKVTPKDVVGEMGKQEFALLSATDAYVFVPGPILGSYSHRMERSTYLETIKYNEAWYKAASKAKLKGARLTFGYISPEATKVLGKSVDSIVTQQLQAALADYREIGARGREIAKSLTPGTTVEVGTRGSKLKLSISGGVEVDDGIVDDQDLANESNVAYIPPGFVYADIAPESVSGTFAFSATVTRFGLLSGGTLKFEKGELLEIKSPSSSVLANVRKAASSKSASAMYLGLNRLLKYGYGQNLNSAGVFGLRAAGVNFTAKSARVRAGGTTIKA